MNFETSISKAISRLRKQFKFSGSEVLPADFDPNIYLELNPDVANSKLTAAQHYVRHGAKEGRPYKPLDERELPADFDPDCYRIINSDLHDYAGDLTQHYLQHGIAGFRKYRSDRPPAIPNNPRYSRLPKDFDPEIYAEINPDLQGTYEALANHYIDHGIAEGRLYSLPKVWACFGRATIDHRKSVLIVSHEATRTGAPILTWNLIDQYVNDYNVIILLLGNGALLENFQFDAHATYVSASARKAPAVADHVISTLCERHNIEFAIVNSVECTGVCESLTIRGIPSICLIHEFAASTPALKQFDMAEAWATRIIFSASITKDNAVDELNGQRFREAMVLPQGRCLVPSSFAKVTQEVAARNQVNEFLQELSEEHRLVIGLGTICYRKGVDAFIECAHRMVAMPGNENLRFLWIGYGLTSPHEPNYAMLLPDQIKRSGLQDVLTIFEDTDDLLSVYERADLLVLSSRLDPLPNVAIDALHLGLPLVCFDKCSGIVQALEKHKLSNKFVAPYFSVDRLAELALDSVNMKRSQQSIAAIKEMAQTEFSMKNYSHSLVQIASHASNELKSIKDDIEIIRETKAFDANYHHGRLISSDELTRMGGYESQIWNYHVNYRSNKVKRKPCPGFHPLAYADRLSLDNQTNPLAHYAKLKNGGSTNLPLPRKIGPTSKVGENYTQDLKIAMHIHAYYTDLLDDVFSRISRNRTSPDIYITTTSSAQADIIQKIASPYSLPIKQILVLENRGRNILPLFKMLKQLTPIYDLIGHIHTKKSEFFPDSNSIAKWRDLVLSNLLGCDAHPTMADAIFQQFHQDQDLDIVFPDDPNVLDWGLNRDVAVSLLDNSSELVPDHFEFPVSAMFWARATYLKEFIHMDLLEQRCPEEPIANDGTVLHAFERLLGSRLAGTPNRIGLTFIDGVFR